MSDQLLEDIDEEIPAEEGEEETPEDEQGSDGDYGSRIEQEARARGWRPKEEWTGEDGDWVDPVKYITGYADRVEKRFDKKLKFIEKEVSELKPTIEAVDKRSEATTKTARDDLETKWDQAIYDHDRSDVQGYNKLLRDKKAALAEFDKANAPTPKPQQGQQPQIDPVAMDFMERHKHLVTPKTADDHANRAWVIGRLQELEEKYPAATSQQLYTQMEKELTRRTSGATPRTETDPQRQGARPRTVARSTPAGARQGSAKGLADVPQADRSHIDYLVDKVYSKMPNKAGKTRDEQLQYAAKRYFEDKQGAKS